MYSFNKYLNFNQINTVTNITHYLYLVILFTRYITYSVYMFELSNNLNEFVKRTFFPESHHWTIDEAFQRLQSCSIHA